jgi:hypothetical protein
MLLTHWEDRLHEPLSDVRKELGFEAPEQYYRALERFKDEIDALPTAA